jgi:hypothetical protein
MFSESIVFLCQVKYKNPTPNPLYHGIEGAMMYRM